MTDLGELLGRPEWFPPDDLLKNAYSHQTVMVTGAGGSIGSAVVERLNTIPMTQLVLLERDEEKLVGLKRDYPRHTVCLCDVTKRERVFDAVCSHCPTRIIHAAAYKHVAALELSPHEAVENNYFGLKNVADAARRHDSGLTFISTDKAVNPVSVMGTTKRLAEFYVKHCARAGWGIVRFGNVLGSSGSVVEIWRGQIERGEPMTVTDPTMSRYFLTMREAADLVLTVGARGSWGETYLLDMGDPVTISELAERMAKGRHWKTTGIKPGEKRHEALWFDTERPVPLAGVPGVLKLELCDGNPC